MSDGATRGVGVRLWVGLSTAYLRWHTRASAGGPGSLSAYMKCVVRVLSVLQLGLFSAADGDDADLLLEIFFCYLCFLLDVVRMGDFLGSFWCIYFRRGSACLFL